MGNKNQEVRLLGNINQDSALVTQPQGTTRFVLNGVNETNEGDLGMLSVEEGNEMSHLLPEGFIPLGSVSISNEESVIFLSDGENSMIITVNRVSQGVTVLVNDSQQSSKLGFSLDRKIDATFRLRRGCERTIYWVDPKPRFFIVDRPDKFKTNGGDWNINSFDLFRKIQKIPKFSDFSVNSSGGSLSPGSYIVSVQYLDNDFNPTEFITSSQPIRIYVDNTNQTYRSIRGASRREESFYEPQTSTKSITVVLENLDTENYPFYRLSFSEVNTGSGLVSEVKYTNEIPTSINRFTYTGINFAEIGTREEVQMFNLIIDEADHIDQLDNQLLLSSTRGNDSKLCNLQKYASKIQVDCVTKRVSLSIPEGANPKNPTAMFEGIGYMPGEIYSLGIVYILEGNIFTPVYHIPGKSSKLTDEQRFTQGSNVYPMSTDNQAEDSVYTDNNSCSNFDLWGLDSQGDPILNTPIRHHRFPFRSDIGLPLVERQDFEGEDTEVWAIRIDMFGEIQIPPCPEEEENCDEFTFENSPDIVYEITYARLDFEGNIISGSEESLVDNINFLNWDNDGHLDTPPTPGTTRFTSSVLAEYGIIPVSITETVTFPDQGEQSTTYTFDSNLEAVSPVSGITYKATSQLSPFSSEGASYSTEVLGVKFSNVEIPSPEVLGGKKVIGYFFVRNERVEEEKTIVDTGIIGPSLINKNFISHSHLVPELEPNETSRIDYKFPYFLNPDFKFNGTTYNMFDGIVKQGEYNINQRYYSRVVVEDVVDGTSYQGGRHKRSERDDDGWQLHVRTRQNKLDYKIKDTTEVLNEESIKNVNYLSALGSIRIEEDNSETLEYWNLVTDNKVGVLELNSDYTHNDFIESVDYVALKRKNANPYANFRSTRYIKISKNYHTAGEPGQTETREEFGGDTYVTPISYVNSIYWDDVPRRRRTRSGLFRSILGGLLILAGAAVAIFTFGLGTPIAIALGSAGIALGATAAAAGLRQESFNRAYRRLWNEGLRDTVLDSFIDRFKDANPVDDEFQWVGDATTLFFETSVNTSLRHGVNKTSDTDFLDAPMIYEQGNSIEDNNNRTQISVVDSATTLDSYMVSKLTYFEPERTKSERAYLSIALPELYILNRDYNIQNVQKVYEHLPIEYDCCSDCLEDFPHRIHHSLQSFEEELTDNFQVFLPNDYKDIEGGTGKIKDMFTMQNNLYIVTQHALWHLPQNFQERVTDSIVSFIGTGEYFATPPRKIVDDEINSAGTSFKWGIIKSRNGVIIIADKENKIYLFSGNELKPISDEGLSAYFRDSLKIKQAENYYEDNGVEYPYLDNTSLPVGSGFISAYDTSKERFIITKKDKIITNLPKKNYYLHYNGEEYILFQNYFSIISTRKQQGWDFEGIVNSELVFSKYEEVQESQEVYEEEPTIQKTIKGTLFTTSSTDQSPLNPITWDNVGGPNGNQFDLANDRFISPGPQELKFEVSVAATPLESGSFDQIIKVFGGSFSNPVLLHQSPVRTNSNVYEFTLSGVTGGSSIWIAVEFVNYSGSYSVQQRSWNWIEFEEVMPEPPVVNTITKLEKVIETVPGEPFLPEVIDNSWTLSYSLKTQGWVSWHSYLPNFYLNETERFYSWITGSQNLWRHNVKGKYQSFYGELKPFIIEFVSNSGATSTKIWDSILYQAECKIYNPTTKEFVDVNETFNKALFYNSHQTSGMQNLVFKTDSVETMLDQITEFSEEIIVDRNERDYTLNNIRDYRDSSNETMFIKDIESLQEDYYIDKKVNPASINLLKDWTELESFRDKYLVIRLIFDTFDNRKLTMFFSMEDIKPSER